MALTVLMLAVPPSNGLGAASDAHLLDAQKSFVLDGTIGPGEVLEVQSTEDPTGASGWNGVIAWTNSNPGDVTFAHIGYWYRIRRRFAKAGFNPTASVAASAAGVNTFFSLVSTGINPGTTGAGPAINISAGGSSVSFTLEGTFGRDELVVIQGSQDAASWNSLLFFNAPFPPRTFLPTSYKFLRLYVVNYSGNAKTVYVGTATSGSGGSGGGIQSVTALASSGVAVNNADPLNPVIRGVLATDATPGDISSTQFLQLRSLPAPWVTVPVPVNTQDVLIDGLNGDADGGYEILVSLLPMLAIGVSFFLQVGLNGAAAADVGWAVSNFGNGTTPGSLVGTNLFLTDSTGANQTPQMHMQFQRSAQGFVRSFEALSHRGSIVAAGTVVSPGAYTSLGEIPAAGNITSLVLHSSNAVGFPAGSLIQYRKLTS